MGSSASLQNSPFLCLAAEIKGQIFVYAFGSEPQIFRQDDYFVTALAGDSPPETPDLRPPGNSIVDPKPPPATSSSTEMTGTRSLPERIRTSKQIGEEAMDVSARTRFFDGGNPWKVSN